MHTLGFHTTASFKKIDPQVGEKEKLKSATNVVNALNIAGYFPITGLITGIIRFKASYYGREREEYRKFNYALIGRGIVECLGAGILLFVIDIIVTIGRHASCFSS
jgi:hypothetical protein